jgi:hypothetical protein
VLLPNMFSIFSTTHNDMLVEGLKELLKEMKEAVIWVIELGDRKPPVILLQASL